MGARTVCTVARDSTGASGKQEKKGLALPKIVWRGF